FAGAASAVLASAGPDALLPFRDVAGAAADVSVAFVIDFGGSAGSFVKCVTVPSGDTGLQALFAVSTPRLPADGSPFVCALNGVPASGCGQVVSGGDIYWSYWHGTSGSWQYSNVGAGSVQVHNGDVEGWRFQNPGNGNPTDPPPRSSADYTAECGPLPPDTATTVVGTPPATAPASAPASPGSASAPSVATGSRLPGSSPGSSTSAPATTTPAHSGPSSTTPQASPGATANPKGSPTAPDSGPRAQSLRALPASAHGGSGNAAAPALFGGLIVLALVGGTLFRWRKRPHTK
ncbi:MAG TPA: hypothetical protein VND67_09030, partial [Acidimicrobiales bacterium]|nr:hypothetical protein [Acidimicrobiales bacterium]